MERCGTSLLHSQLLCVLITRLSPMCAWPSSQQPHYLRWMGHVGQPFANSMRFRLLQDASNTSAKGAFYSLWWLQAHLGLSFVTASPTVRALREPVAGLTHPYLVGQLEKSRRAAMSRHNCL